MQIAVADRARPIDRTGCCDALDEFSQRLVAENLHLADIVLEQSVDTRRAIGEGVQLGLDRFGIEPVEREGNASEGVGQAGGEAWQVGEFRAVAKGWIHQWDEHRDALINVYCETEFETPQHDRRLQLRAVDDGLLHRSLFIGRRPSG